MLQVPVCVMRDAFPITSFRHAPKEVPLGGKPESRNLRGNADVYPNFAGGSPAASHFLLLRQEKVTKEKATLLSRLFGLPCVARPAGRLRNSRTRSVSGYWFGRELLLALSRPARSHSPRRLPPAVLCYSAAQKGLKPVAENVASISLCFIRATLAS